ncbi:hypothetical protein LCGC14_2690430 [marine sediment metagenome]|uniref:Uncharacterized protein n=1 Tax=marine sediment metagenome TaxID=412755 RepID=A0A0F8ZIQ5_9ZZZZ
MTKKEYKELLRLLKKFEKDTGYVFRYYSDLEAEIRSQLGY